MNDMKREIVHDLISFAGKAEIKELKKISQSMYVESEQYEDALLEVADQIKEGMGGKRVAFKVKE